LKLKIKLNHYLLAFFIIVIIAITIGDIIKYYKFRQILIDNFQNKNIYKTQQIREDFRLLFDKLQYNFKKAESQNIQKLNQLYQFYKKHKDSFNLEEALKEINKDVLFGEYQIFFINRDYIIEKASYKKDLGYNLGQYKVLRDLFDSLFKKEKEIDISPIKLDSASMNFKRYYLKLSDDGKYLLQIGFVLNIYGKLMKEYNEKKKITDELEVYIANKYFIQKLEFQKKVFYKKSLKESWDETKRFLKTISKYSNIKNESINRILKSNVKDTDIAINRELDKLFKNDKLVTYLDLKHHKFFVYSITNSLFNRSNETKIIIKSIYSTKDLENDLSNTFNQMLLQFIIIFTILTFIYIFISNAISKKLLAIISHIKNNEVSNVSNIKVKEIEILNNKYNELHNRLNKEISINQELLAENKRFIADTVHQIRTPLTNIMMNSEMIQRTLKSDKVATFINQIDASINMLTNSYEDLAYIISYDHIEYKPANISISNILKKRIEFFATISKVNFKEISANIENGIFININQIELERLIDNNISNGIKYAFANRPITINLTRKDDRVILEFKTFGKPIANKDRLFEKSYRENESKRGLGLGLNMVKVICEKYDISYEVSYRDGQNIFIYIFKSLL